MSDFNSGTHIDKVLELAKNNPDEAMKQLLDQSSIELKNLTRKMFHKFPGLRRWEQTDDVFQNAMMRLNKALREVKIESAKHFYNLAALQIKRELLDLVKKYKAESNFAAHHHTDPHFAKEGDALVNQQPEPASDIEKWSEFHILAEKLPDEEREVVNLVWYQELSQEEAAKILNISIRTLKRRWQTARNKLYETLK
jgi:RNA polymerase sigma-70 factor (ECF subfamily)